MKSNLIAPKDSWPKEDRDSWTAAQIWNLSENVLTRLKNQNKIKVLELPDYTDAEEINIEETK